jgi:phosphoribosyl-ATP pyrophosphohydrolase
MNKNLPNTIYVDSQSIDDRFSPDRLQPVEISLQKVHQSDVKFILEDSGDDFGNTMSLIGKQTCEIFSKSGAKEFAKKLIFEAQELEEEMKNPFAKHVMDELADVAICLAATISRLGYDYNDLVHAMQAKHEINKNRKWKRNTDGTYSHVK